MLTFSDADRDRAGLSANAYAVAGTLDGSQLDVIVTGATRRDGRSVRSEYTGTVSDTAITAGTVTDLANGGSRGWSATGSATCASGSSTGSGSGNPGSITGVWDANNGVWTFTQTGATVTASIQFSGGLGSANVQGTIGSGVIQASRQCNSDCEIPSGGTITLTVSSDGCSMQGSYVSMADGVTTGTGPLTMTKRNCGG